MILRIYGLPVVGIDGIINLRMHDDCDDDPLKVLVSSAFLK
jgi:hypothetical protein